ncbi:MAG TPA: ATP-binding protein, partial [Pyrinomonadaceae bacterium]|nr:ATP-binding protein [Pyrinomonadaceae bacterium]
GVVGVSADITKQKQTETLLRAANRRAIVEYERLLDRLAPLGQALGTARDLLTIFRALRDFCAASMPCIGIFISLYDSEQDVRTAQYAWGEGVEVDVSTLPPMPITDGPNSLAVKENRIIITDDYLKAMEGHPGVKVGVDNGLMPQSSMAAPMSVMGRMVGTIEVQAYELSAYKPGHETAMRVAANLAAVAIDNVRLFERETVARSEAEAASRAKDEFLATLSHELRTPLTAMLGWTSLLRSGNLAEGVNEQALEIIERNARMQSQLIEDILDVSRIITGKLNLKVQPVELSQIIESAANTVRPAVEAKAIDLRLDLDARAGVISGDPTRLQQVVWNLLSNAVKFTPQGGRIEVRLKRIGACVQMLVTDTGAGIGRSFLPFVFDRFRQADSTTTRTHGGLGLGLAIVRHVVEMHGGTVEAVSEGEGKGATFIVSLPVVALRARANEVDMLWEENSVQTPPAQKPASLEGVRLLVVDNEQDARVMIRAGLKEYGAQVQEAASVTEALEILAREQWDVLVSDIGMPGLDGYDLIRRVREIEAEKGVGNLPAIALTAYTDEESIRRALSAGYQMHMAKPVELNVLADAVARLAGRNGKAVNAD